MSSLGIVPAGGQASRFNGLAKELLPVSDTECALTRCVQAIPADEVYVFTTPEKYSLHHDALEFVDHAHLIERHCEGLWEVVKLAVVWRSVDWYYFAMPDTVFPHDAFNVAPGQLKCGTFLTDRTERFGMVYGNKIVDKQPGGKPGLAWGAWIWSRQVALDLAEACEQLEDYTEALNVILKRYSMEQFPLRYYYDFASFADYSNFIKEQPHA